eukprot:s226_g25.t1
MGPPYGSRWEQKFSSCDSAFEQLCALCAAGTGIAAMRWPGIEWPFETIAVDMTDLLSVFGGCSFTLPEIRNWEIIHGNSTSYQ